MEEFHLFHLYPIVTILLFELLQHFLCPAFFRSRYTAAGTTGPLITLLTLPMPCPALHHRPCVHFSRLHLADILPAILHCRAGNLRNRLIAQQAWFLGWTTHRHTTAGKILHCPFWGVVGDDPCPGNIQVLCSLMVLFCFKSPEASVQITYRN